MIEISLKDKLKAVETKYQKNGSCDFLKLAEKFKVVLLEGGRRILEILADQADASMKDNIFIAENKKGETYISTKPLDDPASRD